jgi:hypothetical protein
MRRGVLTHARLMAEQGGQRPVIPSLIWLTRGLWMPKADRRGWWTHGSTRTYAYGERTLTAGGQAAINRG